jgi:hypothetical protein
MTIPVPLSIRLRTATRDIHVTNEVDDLTFGSTSPGGFDAATLSLHRPLRFMPGEIAQFGRVYIYDARNGSTVWEGRLQDPGRSAGSEGAVYQLAAVGGQAHLSDDTRMLFYIDTEIGRWEKIDNVTPASTVEYLTDTGASTSVETPALILRIPQGTAVDGAIPSRCVVAHRGIAAAGQELARVRFDWDMGLTTANLTANLYAATQGVALADIAWTQTFNVAGGSEAKVVDAGAGSSAWTNGRNKPILRFHWTGGVATVSADSWWLQITALAVRTILLNKSGAEITTGYTLDSVYAHEVVEDLLGRILSATVDSANATVFATTYPIEQLAYPDGVTPATVLEDLAKFELGYTYHLWESNPANDKFKFEFIPWPTTVRYEADVIDGFSSPSSGNTVYNKIAVRYTNRGSTRIRVSSQSVPALTAAGFDRVAFVDLGDEASTATNASRVGDQFMAEHQYPLNAGTLTVRTPILDMLTGRMVQPWEIRPGNLIRVRGVESYPNALNNTGRDGNTVFKIAATSYSASQAAATLDLDSFSPSVARAMAALVKRPAIRRR